MRAISIAAGEIIKMAVNKQDVINVANLARLTLSETDIDKYARNLSTIFELASQLNNINTDNIEPMAHPLDVHQRLREDIVTETNQRDLFQQLAPLTEAGLYLVNKVVE